MMCNGTFGHQWNYRIAGPHQIYVCRECSHSVTKERQPGRYFKTRTLPLQTGGVIQIDSRKPVGEHGPYLNIPAFLRRHHHNEHQ